MNSRFPFFLLILFLLLSAGCDRITEDPKGDEMARFEAWIKVNKIPDSCKTTSGLYFIEEIKGSDISPSDSDWVIYSYSQKNLDNDIYLTTIKQTAIDNGLFSYNTHYVPFLDQYLTNVPYLKGLNEGIGMMKEGGKARLIFPSSLGYGKNGYGSIPSYSPLIYDIELVKVFKGDIKEYENSLINDYLADSLGYSLRSDSIYYKLVSSGIDNGGVAKDSIVTVNYTGRFLDGFIFDTNIKSVAINNGTYNSNKTYQSLKMKIGFFEKYENQGPFSPSFHLAVKQMKEGEKSKFVIPSKYMYGSSGNSNGATVIPPYTPLVFEIELVKVAPK